ncbi:hypothetical protein E3N88_13569 [Mikania micrantha]|uniref:Reverse transcriptase zinc-binding domain-containing protein n=1 Tax=Mikania micrantha TaxID=192012 RepID=A0A5N6P8X4_9ASTR|nr:hypothetical protein E3N88_13569 [Mikania micrantha]
MDFQRLIRCHIDNGMSALFWLDNWMGTGLLKDHFPLLFNLEKNKRCKVGERMETHGSETNLKWNWTRNVVAGPEENELKLCTIESKKLQVSNELDRWEWEGDTTGNYMVHSIKCNIEKEMFSGDNMIFERSKWVPIKLNFFGWRVGLDKIPTRVALAKRNVWISSTVCDSCGLELETVDHLFLHCNVANQVWELVKSWCKISGNMGATIKEVLQFSNNLKGEKKYKKLVHSIILVTISILWKARNDRIFSKIKWSTEKIMEEIKLCSFIWIKNRTNSNSIDWSSWCGLNVKFD